MLFAALAYAQDTAAPAAPTGGGGIPPNMIMFYVIFVGAILFLFILPQRKKQKEQEKKLAALKEKDRVVTIGGILGTIMKVKGNIIELKIADNVKIEVLKSSISSTIDDSN